MRGHWKTALWLIVFGLFLLPAARADEVIFNNGDKLTGIVRSRGADGIKIDVDGIGEITVSPRVVKQVVILRETDVKGAVQDKAVKAASAVPLPEDVAGTPQDVEKKPEWSGKISAGFDRRRGNTNTTELTGEAEAARKTEVSELKGKVRLYYSSENRKMNARKYYGLLRYDRSFFESRKFYGFAAGEYNRDRFANIDARYTPGAGIGYKIFTQDDYKLLTEVEVGYTHTAFRDGTDNTDEMVLVPRAYGEVRLIGKSRLSEEIKIYPSMTDTGEYRLYSETVLNNPITQSLSIEFKLIDEYNSRPGPDAKKNDMRLISGLAYTF